MKKSKSYKEKQLTDVELELMTILWKLGEGNVADVIATLPKDRDLAYTSVSTILRILEQKEIVKTRKEGRGHTYIPLLKKSDYEAKTVKHVVDRVFDGAPVSLVKQLLQSSKIDKAELDELREIISQLGARK